MSWTCPYQINNECVRLRKPCQPLQKGCVLEGKVTFIDNQLDSEYKKFYVCTNSMGLLNISQDELVNEVDKSMGITTFLTETGQDQILFI